MITGLENRQRRCKNLIGGLKNAYIAPFRNVTRSEIVYDGTSITEFPETFMYKFELFPGHVFEQRHAENEGGKYYDTTLTLNFNKITVFDNLQFQKLLKKEFFIVLEDNNGNYFLIGFRNGVTAESLDKSTTQYSLDFVGQEEEFAPFVTDIINVDLIIVDGENYIFQDDTDFIFQDDTNYIFQ